MLPACSKSGSKTSSVIIDSISSKTIHGGDTITVYGKHLPTIAGSFTVALNGKPLKLVSSGADRIVGVVPKMAGSGAIVVVEKSDTITGPQATYLYIATVTTIAGTAAMGAANGPALSATFSRPVGIVADANGDLYIADELNVLVRKYTAATGTISQIDIPNVSTFFPTDIALDRVTHNLYLTDFNDHVVKIRPDDSTLMIYNNPGKTAGVAVGPDGLVYVADYNTNYILRMDSSGNNVSVFATQIYSPANLFFDKSGNLFVSSFGLYKITPQQVESKILTDNSRSWDESARDTLGNCYEADNVHNTLRIIEASSGMVQIIAGSGNTADVDGIGLNASFNEPQGICIDDNGVLYMTTHNDLGYGGGKVRRITIQ
jgi:hypothetical protein